MHNAISLMGSIMSKLCVRGFSFSLDGYGAGPDQSLDNPLGKGGMALHQWAFATKTFRTMFGQDGGATGIDDDFAQRSFENIGAWILGRNMFGPVRGPWPDESWKGWWGDIPPYHVPVFVLTHHARAPLVMDGGTTFHFVTDSIESVLDQAKRAAKGKDVRLGGGVATIKQYLRAGLIDEMHLVMSPVFMGTGENLFAGLDLPALGYACTDRVSTPAATHLIVTRQA
ncbi:dihydrofolate reductase family protein [Sphingomonas sp.]|uniref:dihydrofolate reductase family protein n=1 Tax=Sphingomonas sp. TaxID=28214 RepID=UPI0025FAB5FC|nr:dihydrofolate reductase family protein [Sphingomonas sp.]